jgi:pseudaminic acid biosynthesis-associated methylase
MIDDEITFSDLKALIYPSDEEIEKVGVTGLFYGYFFKWDTSKNVELAKQLGWESLPRPWAGSWLDYENCDMKFEGIREHLKWIKYGYGRATDQVNIYIRNNQLTREEALKIVKERDGKFEFKKEFCEYIGITEQEFDKIRDSFVNKDIFKISEDGEWVLKEPLSGSDKTEQEQKWANEFGNEYIDRNPKNIQELDNIYIKSFGITRTSLNKEFLLDLSRDIKILEVGCNVGAQLTGLQELGFEDLTGIEISKKATEQAKQNTKNINFLNASALNLPFKDNSFDLTFTAGVLIHINPRDLNKVIDEIYRTSKKYIWGWEYFSEECQEIEYRGNKNMLWKNNFMQLFLDRHRDLKIIKQKKVKYLDSKNQDHMFLLEKANKIDKTLECALVSGH